MSRPSWGQESRYCPRCGKVGPRVPNPSGLGYIHAYCRTPQEAAAERKQQRDLRQKGLAEYASRLAAEKATKALATEASPVGNRLGNRWPFD